MQLMYDSVTPEDIPTDAAIVAFFLDGIGARTREQMRALFPNATLVTITIDPDLNDGDVLDCERFNMVDPQKDPGRAVDWVLLRRGLGFMSACLYASVDNIAPLAQAFTARGVGQPLYWVADWTGKPHLITNSAATQWISPETGSPGHYDISTTSDIWPLNQPTPPPSTKEDSMLLPVLTLPNGADVVVQLGADGTTLYGKLRSGVTQWANASNEVIGHCAIGTLPVQRIAPGPPAPQYQCFFEQTGDDHVVIAVTDGATWDMEELP